MVAQPVVAAASLSKQKMLSLNNHITVVNGVFCKCVCIVFN